MRAGKLAFGGMAVLTSIACCTISSVDEEGLAVEIALQAAPGEAAPIQNDLGYVVTVTRGFVAVASVRIERCASAASGASALGRLADLARIAPAYAHSTSSPTVLGVPGISPLTPSSAFSADLGELEPPPGAYCSTRVALGPADGDAVALPTDGSMTGRTMLVEGRYRAPDAAADQAFSLESVAAPSSDVAVDFTLDEGGARRVREVISFDLAHAFDGIALDAIAVGDADRVAAAIAKSVHVETR